MELIDPANGGVFRGDDIVLPDTAIHFRCPQCEAREEKRRNTLLFKAVLAKGSVVEAICRRCKQLHRFQAGRG